ncbi:hypothetical protein [Hellea balneolensis]|uniref:hypothetical protein n=1 Tax=Hellea balneolensis TaxID=287478 RepID=UPI00047920BF|nr:hypothetical protein [Hellea balneolensis]
MYFKDLSIWGIFKVSLILDFVIPILLIPILSVIYIFAPKKFTFNWEPKFEINGMSIDFTSGVVSVGGTVLLTLIIGFIGLLVQCAILYFLAQKTPLGRVKISS